MVDVVLAGQVPASVSVAAPEPVEERPGAQSPLALLRTFVQPADPAVLRGRGRAGLWRWVESCDKRTAGTRRRVGRQNTRAQFSALPEVPAAPRSVALVSDLREVADVPGSRIGCGVPLSS